MTKVSFDYVPPLHGPGGHQNEEEEETYSRSYSKKRRGYRNNFVISWSWLAKLIIAIAFASLFHWQKKNYDYFESI